MVSSSGHRADHHCIQCSLYKMENQNQIRPEYNDTELSLQAGSSENFYGIGKLLRILCRC